MKIENHNLPSLTTLQMTEVDRIMIDEYKIQLLQMMENAGGNLARLTLDRFMGNVPTGKEVCIFAGTGGNGGGALVCARILHNRGVHVNIVLSKSPNTLKPAPAHQLEILNRMGIPVQVGMDFPHTHTPDVVIDGIIGYSLSGNPGNEAAELINWVNSSGTPVLSLDIPSGLDATTGIAYDPVIHATATMTLALPKSGLFIENTTELAGEIFLADIGVPPELYSNTFGLKIPLLFSESEIIRLR